MTGKKVKTISLGGERELHIQEDEPLGWFEDLYSSSAVDGAGVPWANMGTHPLFARWLQTHPLDGMGKKALVVGCGMGDDAIELESRGFAVTAFDVAASAVAHCKERFPESKTSFVQADLFEPPSEWTTTFDFVLEIYTVQAVPPAYENKAIASIAGFIAPRGRALVIAEVGAEARRFEQGPPWLLTPQHVDAFLAHDLKIEDQEIDEMGDKGSRSYITTFSR